MAALVVVGVTVCVSSQTLISLLGIQPPQSAHEEEIRTLSAKTELELDAVKQQLQLAQGEASAAAARVESLERQTRGEVDRSALLMAKVCGTQSPLNSP